MALLIYIIIISVYKHIHQCKAQTKVCVQDETSNSANLNVVYHYHSYNSSIRGSIYYNSDSDRYVYPWKTSGGSFKWYIGPDYRSRTVNAYADISVSDPNLYTFDVADSFGKWKVYNGSDWVDEPNMVLVDCSPVCITDNHYSDIPGQYNWTHFENSQKTSVYYCPPCTSSGSYLYGYQNEGVHYVWLIGPDYTTNLGWTYCNLGSDLGTNNHFELSMLNQCTGSWKTTIDGTWLADSAMTTSTCSPTDNEYNDPSQTGLCGVDTIVDTEFHIGDVIGYAQDIIDEICSSTGGQILIKALSAIPPSRALGRTAEAICEGISFLGAICNIFEISECQTEEESSIVASCWSSEEFYYSGISTGYAFKYHLSEEYGIEARYSSTTPVEDQSYQSTEVTFDNCGNSDNYFIAGVYQASDNGEQNDIVSDVTEYLVNQGIASSDNPVGGVSSVDHSASEGVKLTDVIRSKKGLLLHYEETISNSIPYGIFFCEFNVVDIDFNDSKGKRIYCMGSFLQLVVLLMSVYVIGN